jgi:hypothetical protein
MESFEEYVRRRDEASLNPAELLDTPMRYSPSIASMAGSALGAIPAAVSGVTKFGPAWTQGLSGNPYAGDKTKYYRAFEQGRDWLLNFAHDNPKLKVEKLPIAQYLSSVIDKAENYIRQGGGEKEVVPGVTMGRTATLGSKIGSYSLLVPLAKSIASSLVNLRDTLDFPQMYHTPPEDVDNIAPSIEKMLLGLDMINREAGSETALERLHEFKNILQHGGHAGHIDADARVGTSHPRNWLGGIR